jgi:SRSO17 transposase
LKGLIQAEKGRKNMEHMAEVVPDADSQSLQHFISESDWSERDVLNQVAKEADAQLGGKEDSCLIVDESGFAKKGTKSVGVSRQWNGNKGKVDNSQVAVFVAIASGNRATLIDEQLYLPKVWTDDKQRCLDAGIPEDEIIFKQKQEQALEMIYRAKNNGVRYNWIGCDGFYGEDPAFLRMLDFQNEIFMADVHKDQRIYLEDPKPVVPPRKSKRGKAPSRLKAQNQAMRVDEFVPHQPSNAWKKVKIRDSSKGVVSAEILHQQVWLWDGEEEQAHNWHLIIKREINSPKTIKYSLSNADKETSQERLAFRDNDIGLKIQ